MQTLPTALTDEEFARLLGDYTCREGVADELFQADGTLRPVWRPLLKAIAEMSGEELDLSTARADQYLRDAGVYFRQYGKTGSAERDWPLSHLPLVLDGEEWRGIETALIERAELLEAMMADIYGEGRLVADGLLPPSMLASNPEWLRPMVGVRPRGGYFLHHVAFDIGRGPGGDWWVMGDRTQAPSGSGFALETRMATNRAFSKIIRKANVRRLASFYRHFRDALQGMTTTSSSRVGILTPGPLNDTYFEHAYIARYLGFSLMQGSDLTVQDGKLMVRTVNGLNPVEVLWRRMDSGWIDPLELEEGSQIGTPGMVDALRNEAFTMVNALGSGVLEARAMMAFTPRIARHILGHPLTMPNIATWWCGDEAAREYAIKNLDRMILDDAMSTRLPADQGPMAVVGGTTTGGKPVNPDWVRQNGAHLAAQENLSLSTAPALVKGRLEARPMSLRVFLARSIGGWRVMPGGFARIGSPDTGHDVAMQRGGSVADVWVVSESPADADRETLLPASGTAYKRSDLGVLPSTAADNLLWLGRYVERVEFNIRLIRAYHLRLAEMGTGEYPITEFIAKQLSFSGIDAAEPIPQQLTADLAAALRSAGAVRDRFSVDGWNALVDLQRTLADFAERVSAGDDAARAYSVLLRKIVGFSGLVHENMYRFMGWRFLSLGRAIERGLDTLSLVRACVDAKAPAGAFDLAIEVGDSVMTHRRRYTVETDRRTVIELLLLDDMNPRSVHLQFEALREHADYLPHPEDDRMTPFQVRVVELVTRLASVRAEDVTDRTLDRLIRDSSQLHMLLDANYLH
ncbi:circularly permuted type 2 ATP-grasp protein [Maritimibacter sp. DP1N21-5]|uniref:circularly permuted type 2 ATP-grasp protein n=1 Tax=Maritimibacter sp. DP1N21-5 TaxID=2836867 RepID=UPI001C46C64F|nr:circularly permuted type 2 ATP-grasp protein [Maritimibacter sp. DP1N21-5]MBV7409209.1 circularly permuted type 2 ATP-grasp protein [Maritimibacter sp. DP1N21-5]